MVAEDRMVLAAAVQMAGPRMLAEIDDARRWLRKEKAVGVAATQMLARPRPCLHTWTLEAAPAESRRLGDARTTRGCDLVMKPMESCQGVPRPVAPTNNPLQIPNSQAPWPDQFAVGVAQKECKKKMTVVDPGLRWSFALLLCSLKKTSWLPFWANVTQKLQPSFVSERAC